MPNDASDRRPEGSAVDFRLLGGVEACARGQSISLRGAKRRLMLAVLLTADGRPVTTDWLIDRIWDDDPPKTARELLYSYARDLRNSLDKGEHGSGHLLLPQHEGGYRALVDRKQVDVHRFHDLLSAAQSQTGRSDSEAVRLFRDALRQWGAGAAELGGGEPLAGLTGRWVTNYRQSLHEEHRAAVIGCLEAEMRLGHHKQIVSELTDLANADPLDEQVTALLMLAYYRVGRPHDALRAFQGIRERLDDELGSVPGADLVDLHQRILSQNPNLDLPASEGESHTQAPESNAQYEQEPDAGRDRTTPSARAHPAATVGMTAARLLAEGARDRASGEPDLSSWTGLARLLQRVQTEFRGDATAEGALARVERTPEETTAVERLQRVLVIYMMRDQSFQEDITQMVDQVRTLQRHGHVTTITANSIKNSTIFNEKAEIAGDFNIS